ncbi:MAG TPA: ABC transporter permease [Vicinamibacterales bacterium]|nr:ABC transporter permease [Vicinamibacterales bacterium]
MNLPRWIAALPVRVRSIVGRARAENDLDDELSFHVAMQARAAHEAGTSEADAMRRARLDLGGVLQTKERCRDTWPLRWAEDLLHDIRYASRGLRRTPAFSLIAITVLALGIGANTALFSVISGVLLRPLPYPDANRLVRIWSAMPAQGYPRSGTALPDYRTWRATNHSFEEMGASHNTVYNLTGVDPPERLLAARMTASMWQVLRPMPLLGTLFSSDAEQWGHHRVVVVSEGLWKRRFGADPSILGRTVQLNGQPFTVFGVLPASFQYPNAGTELWTPESYAPGDAMDSRSNRFVDVIGRLKPAVTVPRAQADLAVVAAQIRQQFPENAGVDATIQSWREDIVGGVRPTLLLLWGAVAMVLLIACTNVANLVLARSLARRQELTIRVAIGAGRGRLARQLLTENMLLASVGAILGVGLAYALVHSLPTLGPIGMPRLGEVRLDRVPLAFAAGLAVLTGVGFGVSPLRYLRDVDLANDLKESARSAAGSTSQSGSRRVLLIAEVSLSLVLLIGAGLLIVSLMRLQQIDPGFRSDHVLTASVNLAGARYQKHEQIALFVRELIDQVAMLPGVEAAAASTGIPLGRTGWGKFFNIDGRPVPSSLAQVPTVEYRQVTPAYFQALGATVSRGRAFTPDDDAQRPRVAIVNETLATRFWPNEDPIGSRVSAAPPESLIADEIAGAIAAGQLPADFQGVPRLTIVGIVRDVRERGLDREVAPTLYVPYAQAVPPNEDPSGSFFLVVRTATDPVAYRQPIEALVHRLDPDLPIANVQTLEARVAESLARRRFAMMALGSFAGVALLLVVAGMYGVMSYLVTQRRREFGVRIALGATPRDLLGLVLSQGLQITAIGIPLGLLTAGVLSQFAAGQLFEVEPLDPRIYGATALVMAAVAVAACALPALSAARLDPAMTLRQE